MKQNKFYYERNLPHYQPEGSIFFVTFRLADSLPNSIIKSLIEEQEKELNKIIEITNKKEKYEAYHIYQSNYFLEFEKHLDKCTNGSNWLKRNEISQIVYDNIISKDNKEYDLIAFTIMPNHLHLVFKPLMVENVNDKDEIQNKKVESSKVRVPLPIVTDILRKIKGATARECNKLLNRSGNFWQNESYDHVIRNDKQLRKIVKYVLNNPVKAGLVNSWQDWKWNYVNLDFFI